MLTANAKPRALNWLPPRVTNAGLRGSKTVQNQCGDPTVLRRQPRAPLRRPHRVPVIDDGIEATLRQLGTDRGGVAAKRGAAVLRVAEARGGRPRVRKLSRGPPDGRASPRRPADARPLTWSDPAPSVTECSARKRLRTFGIFKYRVYNSSIV